MAQPTPNAQPEQQTASANAPAEINPGIAQKIGRLPASTNSDPTPQLNTGSFFQSTVNRPPMPLK